jgi:hypothetical protein
MGTPLGLRACACQLYGIVSPGTRPQLLGLGNAMDARRRHVNSSINHAMSRHIAFAVVERPILRRDQACTPHIDPWTVRGVSMKATGLGSSTPAELRTIVEMLRESGTYRG